jgi:hypothetical protein
MRDTTRACFEPSLLPNGLPNPRHLSNAAYLRLARRAARRGAARNGMARARRGELPERRGSRLRA